MKFTLAIIFLLITSLLFAQNLVKNPSFENYSSCPNNLDQVYKADGWSSYGQSPDYLHFCSTNSITSVPNNLFGYQYPILPTDSAYCDLATFAPGFDSSNAREFIGSQLLTPLVIGTKYFVSIKVTAAFKNPTFHCFTNKIGVRFSTISYNFSNPAPVNNFAHIYNDSIITDTSNWVIVSGSFVADSTYQYISIGNFFDNVHTDTSDCSGDFAYYYIDDVCISIDSLTCNPPVLINENVMSVYKIDISPNPATNELTIYFTTTDKYFFELYDLIGAKRKSVTFDNSSQTKIIDLTDIESGLYFYSVVDKKGDRLKTGKLIINK